jgi:hypothetical protein
VAGASSRGLAPQVAHVNSSTREVMARFPNRKTGKGAGGEGGKFCGAGAPRGTPLAARVGRGQGMVEGAEISKIPDAAIRLETQKPLTLLVAPLNLTLPER